MMLWKAAQLANADWGCCRADGCTVDWRFCSIMKSACKWNGDGCGGRRTPVNGTVCGSGSGYSKGNPLGCWPGWMGAPLPRFICSWLRAAGCGLGWSTRWCSPAAAWVVVSPRNMNSKSLWHQTCTAGSVLWYKHNDAEQTDALGPDGPFSPVCLGLHVLLRFLILQMDVGGDALGRRLWYRFGSAQPQQLRHSPTTITCFCASPQAPK